MEQISRIGIDTSKHIFQHHGVNAAEEPVLRKKLRRKERFAFLEKLAPIVIAKAHPAVPGWSICGMRVPCAGVQRRAGGGIGWLGRDR